MKNLKDCTKGHLKISIITPSFNQASFLPQCLASVASQTYPVLEHLVYDPGSTDGSREIAASTPHATLVAETDNGQADAVAKGLDAARGDIIGWLNSDDYYADPEVFAAVLDRFSRDDAPEIVYGCADYVDEQGEFLKQVYINDSPEALPWRLQESVGISQPALFLRRSVVEKIGVVDDSLNFCMDYEYWLRAVKAGIKFAFLPKKLAFSRYYSNNKTMGRRDESLREICDMVKESIGYVPIKWLQRYAVNIVYGLDSILKTAQEDAKDTAIFKAELKRLLEAYNSDYDTLKLLHNNAEKQPYSITLKEMHKLGVSLKRPCQPVPMEQKKAPKSVLYTVGDRRWAFDQNWKEEQLKRTREAFNQLKAKRNKNSCVIVGNGPSLNNTNLRLLGDTDVFIANYAFLDQELLNYAKYLSVVNYLVAEQGSHKINQLSDVTKLFPYWLSYCLNEDENTYYFNSIGRLEFSKDIHKNVSWRSTVSFFQMQIAYWLGYQKVLLIGFDHDYDQNASTVEGDIIQSDDDDINHFDRRYFKGKKWQAADIKNMEATYLLAKQAFEEDGREIINCTVGGKLEVFKRASLSSQLSSYNNRTSKDSGRQVDNSVTFQFTQKKEQSFGYPRVLLLDMTRLGSTSATGQLKKNWFAEWPKESFLQVYACGNQTLGLYSEINSKPLEQKYTDYYALLAECDRFSPDLIYYRPVAEKLHLHDFACTAIEKLGVPLVLHIMDDWPERLSRKDPSLHAKLDQSLRELLNQSTTRLSICNAMSVAYRERYGLDFIPIANCINPDDWLALSKQDSRKNRSEEPFVIRYAGGLADNMTFWSVLDIAHTVAALQDEMQVKLEIYTMLPWKEKAVNAFSSLRGISIYDANFESESYRELLSSADALVIAYNFDEESISYIQYSMANKLPECLASAVPVLAYGPKQVATIAYAAQTNCTQLVAERDIQELKNAIQQLVQNPDYCREIGQKARQFAFEHHNRENIRAQFYDILCKAAATHGWSPERSPFSSTDPGLIGRFTRNDRAHYNETKLIANLLSDMPKSSVMIDVGAHHGSALAHFVKKGWHIYAYEPDPANREKLLERVKDNPMVTVDSRAVSNQPLKNVPFFSSEESAGISTLTPFRDSHQQKCLVSTTTVADICKENDLEQIDFLKIDTEGYDLMVLKGIPWDKIRPSIIECKYEDGKTVPLGYNFHDLAQYLLDKGYTVLVSEWHPVVEYGKRHDWHRLVAYPCKLNDANAWGNLIAFREPPDFDKVAALANRLVKTHPEKKYPKTVSAASDKNSRILQMISKARLKLTNPLNLYAVGLASSLLKRIAHYYSRWPVILAVIAIALNTASAFEVPFRWAFLMSGTGMLLFLVGHAASKADYALEAAEEVSQKANSIRQTANSTSQTAGSAQTTANQASQTADSALETANSASQTAASALGSANRISLTADSASQTADSALEKANHNSQTADSALETANSASQKLHKEHELWSNAIKAEKSARISSFARRDSSGIVPKRCLLQITIPRCGSTLLMDALRCHPGICLDPRAIIHEQLKLKGGRYPEALSEGSDASLDLEVMPHRGAKVPTFELPQYAETMGNLIREDEWFLEKIHPAFFQYDVEKFVENVKQYESENRAKVKFIYQVRDPKTALASYINYQKRDPSWHSDQGDPFAYMKKSYKALLTAARKLEGLVVDYSDLQTDLAETLRSVYRFVWEGNEKMAPSELIETAVELTARDKRFGSSNTTFLSKQAGDSYEYPRDLEPLFEEHSKEIEICYEYYQELLRMKVKSQL